MKYPKNGKKYPEQLLAEKDKKSKEDAIMMLPKAAKDATT